MKWQLTELKDNKLRCAHCDYTEELPLKLSKLLKCEDCNKDHYLEVSVCPKCGEHYYLYQTIELLLKRVKK
jgi:Zn finger protein HypA/HybF involved in hydrogenase expression